MISPADEACSIIRLPLAIGMARVLLRSPPHRESPMPVPLKSGAYHGNNVNSQPSDGGAQPERLFPVGRVKSLVLAIPRAREFWTLRSAGGPR